MLEKLFVENFALIEKLEILFYPGFNVLTGETGAGKSIIIDAVSVVLGGQGLTEYIRSGAKKALIEAVFDCSSLPGVKELLANLGLLGEENEPLILSRELVKGSGNTCRINGRQVNLSVYKDLTRHLVDIYGQHHQQSLLDPLQHIDLLDAFGGEALLQARDRVAIEFRALNQAETRLKDLETNEQEQVRMADFYKFQLEEIDRLNPVPGEDTALQEEKLLLANSARLAELAVAAYQAVYEGGHHKPAVDLLGEGVEALRQIAAIDQTIRPVLENLETALFQAEETARDVKNYLQKLEVDPGRLEALDNRLHELNGLKRKYGHSLQEVLKYREEAAAALNRINHFDEELAALRREVNTRTQDFNKQAKKLTELRQKAALALVAKITTELIDLNMPQVTFDVALEEKSGATHKGCDQVEFLISLNKGEPLKPLAKIVSGGEVSRIMLAFRTILTDAVPTLIFDEIDAGIGGQAIHAVAQKLAFIGRQRQVICITHAPQIAGAGHHHFLISKRSDDYRTFTEITELSGPDRVDELARMINGGIVTEAIRKHAQDLLKSSF